MKQDVYISVDIEAAGPIAGTYSMLSLGACLVSDPGVTFYEELQPITDAVDPQALEVSGFSLQDLRERGHEPREVMVRFAVWVRRQVANDQLAIFVGFSAPFDWSFVNWYCHTYLGENPFGIAALDVKAYYMGLTGCTWAETSKAHIPERFRSGLPHTHSALADAQRQAHMFAKMREARR